MQILNEIANVARRKMQMSWADTHAFLNTLRGVLAVHPLTVETHETGLRLAEQYGFSIYDAMIVTAAIHAGCDTYGRKTCIMGWHWTRAYASPIPFMLKKSPRIKKTERPSLLAHSKKIATPGAAPFGEYLRRTHRPPSQSPTLTPTQLF